MQTYTNEQFAALAAMRMYPDTYMEYMSRGKWMATNYHRLIARTVADAVYKGRGRIIVTAPPRHMKSFLLSWWTPTWFLDNWPEKKVILASYGQELAVRFGRMVRDTFSENENIVTKLSESSQAAGRWDTKQGGGMMCVGVDGTITGWGGDLILVDDAFKNWEEAQSAEMREKTWDWFTSTLWYRKEPNATFVVYAHRMHTDDLIGRLQRDHGDQWTVLNFPAIAEPGDILGRKEGEALCEWRVPIAELLRDRNASPRASWQAMMQQNPESFGTGRVYDRYNPAIHNKRGIPLRRDLPLQMCWDFNVNPGVHVGIGQYDPRQDVFTTNYEIFRERLKVPQALVLFEKFIRDIGGWQFPTCEVFGDASGNTENTQTAITDYILIREKLSAMGIRVVFRVPRKNPPVKARIESVQEALLDANGESHWKIDPYLCPRLIADFERIKEGEDGLINKTDHKLSHISDGWGYLVTAQRRVITNIITKRSFSLGDSNGTTKVA